MIEDVCHICHAPVQKYEAEPEQETDAGGQWYYERLCASCRGGRIDDLLNKQKELEWRKERPRPRYIWFKDKDAYIQEKRAWFEAQGQFLGRARLRRRCGCGGRVVKGTILCQLCWERRRESNLKHGAAR